MENMILENSNIDLYNDFSNEKYNELISNIDENVNNLVHEWLEAKYDALEKSLLYNNIEMKQIRSSIKNDIEKDIEKEVLLKVGELYGVDKVLSRLLHELSQDYLDSARHELQETRVKHLADVLDALETHGNMTHDELSKYLGINKSTLTEAMKKILATDYVTFIQMGKFKLYSLTDAGIRYVRRKRKEQNLYNNESFITTLKRILDSIPDDQIEECADFLFKWLKSKRNITQLLYPEPTSQSPYRPEMGFVYSYFVNSNINMKPRISFNRINDIIYELPNEEHYYSVAVRNGLTRFVNFELANKNNSFESSENNDFLDLSNNKEYINVLSEMDSSGR